MTIVQQDQQATGLRQKDIDNSRKEGNRTNRTTTKTEHPQPTRSIGY